MTTNSTQALFANAMGTGNTSSPTSDPSVVNPLGTDNAGALDMTEIMASQGSDGQGDEETSQDSSGSSDASPSSGNDGDSDSGDSSSDQKKTPSQENVEYLSVTDHQGRKVKVKVDYSDKEAIKRAYNMAAGARKWQVERDNLKKELDSFQESAGKKVENWDLIDSAFSEGGIQGLVNFLEGDEAAFDRLVDKRIKEREWLETATPQEIALRDAQRTQAQKDKEMDAIRKELESIKQSQMTAKEEAELSSVRSTINPVFDKYRFADKLGDPAKEYRLDKMLYREALEQLEAFPDDADITPEVIHKVFKDTANDIRSLINQQANKKAETIVADKKRQATEQAQVKTQKSMSAAGQNTGSSMSDLLKKGSITDIFKRAAQGNKNFIK